MGACRAKIGWDQEWNLVALFSGANDEVLIPIETEICLSERYDLNQRRAVYYSLLLDFHSMLTNHTSSLFIPITTLYFHCSLQLPNLIHYISTSYPISQAANKSSGSQKHKWGWDASKEPSSRWPQRTPAPSTSELVQTQVRRHLG